MELLELGRLVGFGTGVVLAMVGAWFLLVRVRRERSTEARLRQLEQRLACHRALVRALPNYVLLLESGGVRLLNDAAQKAWAKGHDELLPTSELAATPRDVGRLERLRDGNGVTRMRLRARDASGREFPSEVVAVHAVLNGEKVVIADVRDVGEREEMEQRIRVMDRLGATGTMAAAIAHEINNPLTYIASNIAYVRDSLDASMPELVDALNDSSAGVQRVTAIVRELREFSGLDSAEETSTPLARPLRFALRLTKHVLRHNCEVVTRFADDLPSVNGDDGRLSQVFVNLLTNAAEAMPSGRSSSTNRVILDAHVGPSHVDIVIRDNGRGMNEDEVERVFDPFLAAEGELTQLGLSTSHRIVETLGGRLQLESTPGVGTTVTVRLPRSEPAVRSVRQPTPTARTTGGRRVLLIDDEPNVLRGMMRILSRDYDVVTAGSGSAAKELFLAGEEFDVVLCDMMMPEMTGRDVLDWLQAHRPEHATRFAIVTGGAVGVDQSAFLERAKVPVLRKPLTRAELTEAIDRLADADSGDEV